jgi:hypothetical protein
MYAIMGACKGGPPSGGDDSKTVCQVYLVSSSGGHFGVVQQKTICDTTLASNGLVGEWVQHVIFQRMT